MPAFRRICSARLSSFYIGAARSGTGGARRNTKPTRTAKPYRVAGLLERANLSLLTPAGKHTRTFQEDLYCDNWPTRMITKPAIIKTARPLISPAKPSTQGITTRVGPTASSIYLCSLRGSTFTMPNSKFVNAVMQKCTQRITEVRGNPLQPNTTWIATNATTVIFRLSLAYAARARLQGSR